MTKYADLEIGLHRRDAEQYQIELRFSRPDSDVDDQLVQAGVQFDEERLRPLMLDDAAYGKLLGECLFMSQEVWAAFDKCFACSACFVS
jgi:hypothetical protein